ncbi:hypothetical protein BHM03_00031665 [Ensete ventricosum]|nr:hypothetical protein BHM03_00031665 [Ensete ventricosum]
MYAFQFIICYLMFHKACREMPLGEGLRYQIEVQRKLQEQLEVSLMVQCKRKSKHRGCKPAFRVDSALTDTSDAVVVCIEFISSLMFPTV